MSQENQETPSAATPGETETPKDGIPVDSLKSAFNELNRYLLRLGKATKLQFRNSSEAQAP